MPYIADSEIDLRPDVESKYIISSQHRRTGNHNKCTWIASFDEEVQCFSVSYTEKWIINTKAWGFLFSDNTLKVIGCNNKNQELKLAKFVDAGSNNVWHGYPADPMNRIQDIPVKAILLKWVANKYITKATMSKLTRGLSCNL